MTRVADTSFLFAAFDAGDRRQPEALDRLADPEPIDLPAPTLAEFLLVLTRKKGHAAAVVAWQDLERLGSLAIVHPPQMAAALELWRQDARTSFVDALGVMWALAGGHGLLTYDGHQSAILAALRRAGPA
jgi:predicted nucleic acid-binding protein